MLEVRYGVAVLSIDKRTKAEIGRLCALPQPSLRRPQCSSLLYPFQSKHPLHGDSIDKVLQGILGKQCVLAVAIVAEVHAIVLDGRSGQKGRVRERVKKASGMNGLARQSPAVMAV